MSDKRENASATGDGEPWSTRKRRLGRFDIAEHALEHNYARVMVAMLGVIVIRCEHDFSKAAFSYTGISQHFDIVEEGAEIPRYDMVMTEGSVQALWKRSLSGDWAQTGNQQALDAARYQKMQMRNQVMAPAHLPNRAPTATEMRLKREEATRRISRWADEYSVRIDTEAFKDALSRSFKPKGEIE